LTANACYSIIGVRLSSFAVYTGFSKSPDVIIAVNFLALQGEKCGQYRQCRQIFRAAAPEKRDKNIIRVFRETHYIKAG
jgi:hypothetical protein